MLNYYFKLLSSLIIVKKLTATATIASVLTENDVNVTSAWSIVLP